MKNLNVAMLPMKECLRGGGGNLSPIFFLNGRQIVVALTIVGTQHIFVERMSY